ncbi:MAG: hypothetical protein E6Q26_06455 [Acinetobacter sp.]|nr:MAG: hypothetical protein E6Q26_06455 [Acinetobacter sp.]
MKKIVYLTSVLVVLCAGKLSYDAAQNAQAVSQVQQQLQQTEQRYALLNDQLVALQRQLQQSNPSELNATQHNTAPPSGVAPTVLIQQQLQLVQFAVDQQQFIYALDQLQQLQQQLPQLNIAPALEQSLLQAITQDQQAIQQFVLAQTQQQQQIDQLLQQLDRQLQQQMQNPQLNFNNSAKPTGWSWFSVEKLQRAAPDLMQRHLSLKEIQLRLLLAAQALHAGQSVEYRKAVQEVLQLLAALPDPHSQQLKLRLEKMTNLPVLSKPKLSTLALLG